MTWPRPLQHVGFWGIVTGGAFALLGLFLVYPLAAVFQSSLVTEAGNLGEAYRKFFTHGYYFSSLTNSLVVSALATVGALVIGVPLAYIVTRYAIPGRAFIRAASVIVLLSPPFIGAYSWIILFGRSGLVTMFLRTFGLDVPTIYGPPGIILVFIVQYYPFVFLIVSAAIHGIDQSIEDAARNLGSGEIKTFFTIILPILMPAITAGGLLVFMSGMADFGTPMILGENFRVLPTQIYGEFINELGGNPTMASAMSVILVFLCTSLLLLQRYYAFRKTYHIVCLRPLEVRNPGLVAGALMAAYAYGVLFVSLIPTLVILASSFAKTKGSRLLPEFSLMSYERVLHTVPTAITNTFFLGAVSTALDIALGMFIAYVLVRGKTRLKGLLDTLVMLPYAIPGTVIGVGFIIVFNQPPLLITGTWMILVVAYVVRRLPYAVRSCSAILHQIDTSVEEASINLGVPPMQTFFRVVVPLMGPAIIAGGVLTWVTVVSELSSTILLYYGPWATMSVKIFGHVFSNEFGTASALASILMAATFVPLLLMYRLLRERAEQAI
jgi:iron(III) transport system permease protein